MLNIDLPHIYVLKFQERILTHLFHIQVFIGICSDVEGRSFSGWNLKQDRVIMGLEEVMSKNIAGN